MAPSLAVVFSAFGIVLCTRDYNLAPSALVAAFSKISKASLTKTSVWQILTKNVADTHKDMCHTCAKRFLDMNLK